MDDFTCVNVRRLIDSSRVAISTDSIPVNSGSGEDIKTFQPPVSVLVTCRSRPKCSASRVFVETLANTLSFLLA